MNNVPENILQQVADAAFEKIGVQCYKADRRAVIQHALDNPALAPLLAGGIGEYTDKEILHAWNHREYRGGKMSTTRNLRAFLAALPRRENTALADAIARAEKAEAERDFERSTADEAIARSDRTYAQICRAASSVGWINMAESGPITTFIRKIGDELAAMTALADRLAEALDFIMNGNTAKDQAPFIDASREALAAYENHKKGNTP